MEDEFSPAARRALDGAGRFALGRGAALADLVDLFAALLADDEGYVQRVFLPSLPNSQTLVEALVVPGRPLEDDRRSPPFAGRLVDVIADAKRLALAYDRLEPACSEELLLCLLRSWPEAAPVLAAHGVRPEALLESYHARKQPAPIPLDPAERADLVADPVERTDLARILDASANRAREALRVIEDYARFALDDRDLNAALKQARHALRHALAFFPVEWFASARDTERDVGVEISTPDERCRAGIRDVVAANCRRATEALRSLEEYAKIESARAARELERIRYTVYSLEKRLIGRADGRARLELARLYWLADPHACAASLDWMVRRALEGGVDVIQLRAKQMADRELVEIARELRRLTAESECLFLVNDRVDIARLANADGVHLGQEDLPVREARRILGPEPIIGVSTHSLEQALGAVREGADYLGVGPVFPSGTKSFAEFPGLEFVGQAAARIAIPWFAIGGIDGGNVEQVIAAGGERIAVGRAIGAHADPLIPSRSLVERLRAGR